VVAGVALLVALGAVFLALLPRKLIATASVAPPGAGFLIAGARVFDGERDLGLQDVLVAGDRIVSVGAPGSLALPPGGERIEAVGRTLLPGLVDAHGHLESNGDAMWDLGVPELEGIAQGYLYGGVTSVLVLQAHDDQFAFARRATAGEVASPRLLLSGPRLTAPEGFPIPLFRKLVPWPIIVMALKPIRTAASPEEAIREVDDAFARFHPKFYKLTLDDIPAGTPKLGPEVIRAAVGRAHHHGMRVVAHVGHPEDLMVAAEAGVDLFAHPPSGALLSEAQLARLKTLSVPFVSTLQFLDAPVRLATDGPTALERQMVRAETLEIFGKPPPEFEPPGAKDVPAFNAEVTRLGTMVRRNARLLIAAGIPMFAGTDAGSPGVFPGASIHRELAMLVGLGMTPAQALSAATAAPANFLDPERGYGRIGPGKGADLLLVEGDPLSGLANLERIVEVFQGGRRVLRTP